MNDAHAHMPSERYRFAPQSTTQRISLAADIEKALRHAFSLGQIYWHEGTADKFRALVDETVAALSAPASSGASEPEYGYTEAFYEISALLGIGAQDATPEAVFKTQMLPKLRALIEADRSGHLENLRTVIHLGTLLAVIHRDGGHHQQAVGTEIAVQDALIEYYRLRAIEDATPPAEAVREPPTWQPVETAPSDTVVLLYSPERHATNPERIELTIYRNSRAGSTHAWATHWMPLPPFPAIKTGITGANHGKS